MNSELKQNDTARFHTEKEKENVTLKHNETLAYP
jgi:hypothetical protein